MKPTNTLSTLWSRTHFEQADIQSSSRASQDNSAGTPPEPNIATSPPEPNTPICCWNLCGNYAGEKQPRSMTPSASSPALFLPEASAPAFQFPVFESDHIFESDHAGTVNADDAQTSSSDAHGLPLVAKRLLIERVSPDRSLVFNALSGAVDVFCDADLAELELLRQAQSSALSPEQMAFLRSRGHLRESEEEEDRILQQAVADAWQRMQTRQPEMYTVCPTLACNLACAYCFEGDSLRDKPQGVMTELQVQQLFSAIGGLRSAQAAQGHTANAAPWIALFGGEPLLPSTRHCVGTILRSAAEGGFLVGATTNGVNLTRFESLLTEYADILTTFQITLDGPQAVHDTRRHRLGGQGTFEEIVRGIDLLLFLGVEVDLRVNLDRNNLAALPELADFIFQKGWNQHPGFALVPAGITAHGSDAGTVQNNCGGSAVLSEVELAQGVLALLDESPHLAEICHLGFLRHLDYLVGVLEPQKRRRTRGGAGPRYWYCEASTDKQFVFTPEGLIYSCTEAVGKPQHAIGRYDPELELWHSQAKQWIGRTVLSHPQCQACAISTLCGGGCHFAARERKIAEEKKEPLLQISVRGKTKAGQIPSGSFLPSHSDTSSEMPHPYCNAAEQTVRAYLNYIGRTHASLAPSS